MPKTQFAPIRDQISIAYKHDGPADKPNGPAGLIWLGGFMSDMEGSKAQVLAAMAEHQQRPNLRFDYSGHGVSGGKFIDGTISKWLSECAMMFLTQTSGKRIIVGSSMGGWLAALLYKFIADNHADQLHRIAGIVLIAPALDMTQALMWDSYDKTTRDEIIKNGYFAEPSEYGDEPYIITRDLIEDGARHCLLENGLIVHCPVRVLQGEQDRDVSWQHGLRVYETLDGNDVTFTMIKGGDHRLSNPQNLSLIEDTCSQLLTLADA